MKIVQISPGSGDNFYCANCLRDAALARAMDNLGNDVTIMPMYLPGQFEEAEEIVDESPLFFGGINVFLQQQCAIFRHTPRCMDRMLDARPLLKMASKKAGTTSAKSLGQTTVSMLKGRDGRQAKELDRLVDWLEEPDNTPDIVCLSDVLLAGLAEEIHNRLGVVVVSLLQDEDEFLDFLNQPYRDQAWELLRQCCEHIDHFVSSSQHYATAMSDRLGVPSECIDTVYNGIDLHGIQPVGPNAGERSIGYLSRMARDKGLDLLAKAFINLKKREEFEDLNLKITGGKTTADDPYIETVQHQLATAGVKDDTEFIEEFDTGSRETFFEEISALSVPEKRPVSNSRYVLEALARSIPVVQPDHGVFPEILNRSGGGLLFEPENVKDLTEKLASVLADPDYAKKLGQEGRSGLAEHFDIASTAQAMTDIFHRVISDKKGS